MKAFLFDLDGVIVDTAVFHFQAWRRMAQQLGGDFTEEQNEALKGVSRKDSLLKIIEWTGASVSDEEFERLMAIKNQWYLDLVEGLTSTDALPGAIEFIQSAHKQGYKIALGSASKNAPKILDILGITPLFHAIIDGNNVVKGKPDPEVFLKGAAALGVAPEECVVFEDSAAGIAAAKTGGMKTVAIGSPAVLPGANIHLTALGDSTPERIAQALSAK